MSPGCKSGGRCRHQGRAVYGQLAGAFYGEERIPQNWLEKLAMRGKGVDVRLSGNNLTGAVLVADNRINHLSVFMTGK
jgi:hypothetical protein